MICGSAAADELAAALPCIRRLVMLIFSDDEYARTNEDGDYELLGQDDLFWKSWERAGGLNRYRESRGISAESLIRRR
jgi:hypothetical protein